MHWHNSHQEAEHKIVRANYLSAMSQDYHEQHLVKRALKSFAGVSENLKQQQTATKAEPTVKKVVVARKVVVAIRTVVVAIQTMVVAVRTVVVVTKAVVVTKTAVATTEGMPASEEEVCDELYILQ